MHFFTRNASLLHNCAAELLVKVLKLFETVIYLLVYRKCFKRREKKRDNFRGALLSCSRAEWGRQLHLQPPAWPGSTFSSSSPSTAARKPHLLSGEGDVSHQNSKQKQTLVPVPWSGGLGELKELSLSLSLARMQEPRTAEPPRLNPAPGPGQQMGHGGELMADKLQEDGKNRIE